MAPLNAGSIILKYFTTQWMYQIKCHAIVMSIKADWFSCEIVSFICQKLSKNWVFVYLRDH